MSMEQLTQYRLIDDWVEKLLHQYKSVMNKQINLPIPILDIAEEFFGIRFDYERFKNKFQVVSGFVFVNKQYVIINRDQPLQRQSFTIAHEIAHWLLESKEGSLISQDFGVLPFLFSTNIKKKETIANYFAGSLLIPRNILVQILREFQVIGEMEKYELSMLFQVSNQTMQIRLDQLRHDLDELHLHFNFSDEESVYYKDNEVFHQSIKKTKLEHVVIIPEDNIIIDHHLLRKISSIKNSCKRLSLMVSASSIENCEFLIELRQFDEVIIGTFLDKEEAKKQVQDVVSGEICFYNFGRDRWLDRICNAPLRLYGQSSIQSGKDLIITVLWRSSDNKITYKQPELVSISKFIESQIELKNRKEAAKYIKQKKALGRKVILVTGCFDIITNAHVRFLKRAKAAGDILVVGLEDDNRIRALKGDSRPVNTISQRVEVISELTNIVDFTFVIKGSPNTPLKIFYSRLHETLKPDVLAVTDGDIYLEDRREEIEAAGGKLLVVSRYEEGSTSSIIRKALFQIPELNRFVLIPKKQLLNKVRKVEDGWQQLNFFEHL